MKNKEEKKNRIWVPIVIGALACSAAVGTGIALVHNQQRPKAGTVATMSDAADISGLTTEVTTEEATTEAVIEAAVSGSEKPEAVPATTEIGGGKKKAEETTEEKKPSTTESTKPSTNHSNSSNSGSASSGQSTAPKPSNSGSNSGGNSGNSGSGNSGSSNSAPSQKPSTPATTEAPKPATTEAQKPSTTEAPTTQHQHVYDQEVIDTPAKSIYHPEEGYYAPAMRCNTCCQVFTSSADFVAHATYGGGSCPADGYGSTQVWIKTKDEYTETIPAKTHRECKCGVRE